VLKPALQHHNTTGPSARGHQAGHTHLHHCDTREAQFRDASVTTLAMAMEASIEIDIMLA
jgi:hypothetical protein